MRPKPDSFSEAAPNTPEQLMQARCVPPMLFLYVKIPVVNNKLDQLHRREEKIDQILMERGIGSVAGWGGSLGDTLADGSRPVAFIRIDVDVTDIAAARALLHERLPGLGAPADTEIHYTIDQLSLIDIYSGSEWLLDQPAQLTSRDS